MRKVLSFLLTGTAIFCMFFVNGSLAYARGGTGIYSANQSKSFWAGNTYVRCTYGVDGRTAYIWINSYVDCYFSIDSVAYDYWDNEYRLYGGASCSRDYGVSASNSTFDQMYKIEGSIRADDSESGTSVYLNHDFRNDF